MLRKKSGSLEWLEFEILQEFSGVRHGVFLRREGNDEEALIRKQLGCKALASGKHVHGIGVEIAPLEKEEVVCDGLITQKRELGLFIRHADCQAVILYDPIEQALGCVHAGWRGNVGNIYGNAIAKMGWAFGSKPENLFVGVSPGLGPCCAEFINYEKEIPSKFWSFQEKPLYFNLGEMARFQLIEAGVVVDHIEIAPVCTCCNQGDFYSYRRDKTKERNVTVALMVDVDRENPADEIEG